VKDELIMIEQATPIQPGQPAPDFTLPALHREGTVSLADYRGQRPVLVALFRGLHCAFCRRHVAQLGLSREKLERVGVETLAITATPVERAKLYLRFHPPRVPLAADPEMVTHRSFGLPLVHRTPELGRHLTAMYLDLAQKENAPVADPSSVVAISKAVGRLDNFEITDADWDPRYPNPIAGQFLLDQQGVVRWANVEGAGEGLTGIGKFPTDEELLAATRALPK
jgi:peroxiredoxin